MEGCHLSLSRALQGCLSSGCFNQNATAWPWLQRQTFTSRRSGAWKSEVTASADPASGEDPFWFADGHLLMSSHGGRGPGPGRWGERTRTREGGEREKQTLLIRALIPTRGLHPHDLITLGVSISTHHFRGDASMESTVGSLAVSPGYIQHGPCGQAPVSRAS